MTIVDQILSGDSIYTLGTLCRKKHRYEGQDFSLRLKSNNSCCECKIENRKERDQKVHPDRVKRKQEHISKPDKHIPADMFNFNPERHKLGTLCKERHNYDNTGKSIRKLSKVTSTGNCLACEREQYNEKARLRIIEQHKTQPYVKDCKCDDCQVELKRRADQRLITQRETQKEWIKRNPHYQSERYWRNPELERAKDREWYKNNREQILTRVYAYRNNNREQVNEIARRYRQTEKGKLNVRLQKQVRLGREKKPGTVRYTPQQWRDRVAKFSYECAYCGENCSLADVTLDHVIPLSDPRGFDSLNNIVPACNRCNCKSKLAKRMAIWYPKQPFFAIERFEKILSVLGENEFNAILEDFSWID